nr:hypothetical protein [Tanacetum cinerariifolium]
ISGTPSNLTPSGESDFFLEVDAFLAVDDDPTSSQFPKSSSKIDSLLDEFAGNLYVYDPNPNSFDFPPDSYHPPHPTYETYSYDSYGNHSQFGYDCQPQFSLNYESERATMKTIILIHMIHRVFHNNIFIVPAVGSPVIHQPPQELSIQEMEDMKKQYLDELQRLSNLEYRDEIKIAKIKENFNGMSIEIQKKEKLLQQEQWVYLSTHPSKRLHSFCFDDDDEDYTSAITPNEPVLSTEKPDNSLSMRDEHLDTIPATKSDEFIKSGVENLIPIPSESEGIPDHMCDVPSHDNSPPLDASPPDSELISSEEMEIVIPEVRGIKASNDNPILFYDPIISGTPSNLTPSGESDLFLEVDAFLAVEDEFHSSQFPKSYLDPEGDMLLFEAFLNDDHSSDFKTKSSSTSLNSLLEKTHNFNKSLPEFTTFSKVLFDAECESDSSDDQSCSDEDVLEKIVLKPLCEEEIIPMKSLRTHDSSLPISSKIDSLLEEFAGELTLLKSIPPGIDETDCDFEEDIRLIEKLLYDNSSPRPPKEFIFTNSDAATESFSPSPILVKDSDLLMKEIDLFCTPDYPMPPSIVDKDYESERDILIPNDLPSNNSLSFAEKESFYFDILLFSRPPAKPPDGDTGILNIKMMGDISDQKAFMHKLTITLAPHQEKSPDLISHRCGIVNKFNTHRSHLNKCLMKIFHVQNGKNTPLLDVLLFYFYPS